MRTQCLRRAVPTCDADSRLTGCCLQVRSLPIRKDDEVQIVRGKFAKEPAGKVTAVYRRRFCIYIDRIVKEKANGSQVRLKR